MAALAIGLAAGIACATLVQHTPRQSPADFEFWWRATRLWLAGIDPYTAQPRTANWPLYNVALYPFPAFLLTVPFAVCSLPIAAGLFLGLSSAWLAWVVSRDGLWRLLVFMSPGFVMALKLGQWSPSLTAATLVPSMAAVLLAKPTLGVACFVYRPTWRGAAGVLVLGAVSLLIFPRWPVEWLHNVWQTPAVAGHHPLLATALGAPVLLALLRWRRPEARFLVAMACVPQLLFFADQLPLGLIARTRQEALFLSLCGFVAFLAWALLVLRANRSYVLGAEPYVVLGCYLPALLLVLRRPNEGELPALVDRFLTRPVARA